MARNEIGAIACREAFLRRATVHPSVTQRGAGRSTFPAALAAQSKAGGTMVPDDGCEYSVLSGLVAPTGGHESR